MPHIKENEFCFQFRKLNITPEEVSLTSQLFARKPAQSVTTFAAINENHQR